MLNQPETSTEQLACLSLTDLTHLDNLQKQLLKQYEGVLPAQRRLNHKALPAAG